MIYDDFYNEYNELDNLIMELKETALKGVKQDILDKIDRLEKENQELTEVKNNWEKLKSDYEQKEKELLIKVKNAEIEAKRLPIKELFENIQEEYYIVNKKYGYIDKCDKCDNNRKLKLIDVYGRETKIDCVCNKEEYIGYEVKTKYLIGIDEISKSNGKLRKFVILSYHKKFSNSNDGYYSSGTYLNENIVKTFEEALNKIKYDENIDLYFTNKEEAQKYADYLNENNKSE